MDAPLERTHIPRSAKRQALEDAAEEDEEDAVEEIAEEEVPRPPPKKSTRKERDPLTECVFRGRW